MLNKLNFSRLLVVSKNRVSLSKSYSLKTFSNNSNFHFKPETDIIDLYFVSSISAQFSLFDIKQWSLYPRTVTFRTLAGLVQFIFIKFEITLTAVCGRNDQTIIGMLKTLDKMPEVILRIFLGHLQMPGNVHQIHGTIFEQLNQVLT